MQFFNTSFFLKRFIKLLILIFSSKITGISQVFPIDTIQSTGNDKNRILLVYLGDGYTNVQLDRYKKDVKETNIGFFTETPFKEYKNFFNTYAINVPSIDSGAIHPATATDESSSNGQPVANPNNYFKSTYDFNSIHRSLVPTNKSAIYNVLADNIPNYDQIIVIVNSPYYGGTGGAFSTISNTKTSVDIALHEMGHSFAGLADEYWPEFVSNLANRPNCTQDNNPATVKWKKWYGINDIGIYPYGSGYMQKSWYRPHPFCKMRSGYSPFCSVCTEAIINQIHQMVNMIDSFTPSNTAINLISTNPVLFEVNHLQTIPSTINVQWYFNGNIMPSATNLSTVSIPYASFVDGNNRITAQVIDNTKLSKSILASAGYINSITWSVYKQASPPTELTTFAGKVHNTTEGLLTWEVTDSDNIKNFELEKGDNENSLTSFIEINIIPNEKKYTFTDTKLLTPSTFYRLKVIYKDGSSKYSNIIKLSSPLNYFSYELLQNAVAHQYHLSYTLSSRQNSSLSILSINGQEVHRKNFGLIPAGSFEYDIDLSNKPAGIYIAKIQIGEISYIIKLLAN